MSDVIDKEVEFGIEFQKACKNGNIELSKELLKKMPDLVWYRDPETGESPLHWAAGLKDSGLIRKLFESRHPWNILDNEGRSAGEIAEMAGFDQGYELILEEGVRAELILDVLEQTCALNDSQNQGLAQEPSAPNADYLEMPLNYSEDKLLDAEGNGVMMGWETPLMKLHADILAPSKGLTVLNIGFGLGIIDRELQDRFPSSHTIVEAHPDVYKHMIDNGWDKKPGVRIIFGRWQDHIETFSDRLYDGIFFDTFGEFYKDMKDFHEIIPNILKESGAYTFFNGLGGDVKLFHDVYCRIAQLHLAELGLETTFDQVQLDPSSAKIWDGVKRRYWQLTTYHIPTCKFRV